MGLTGNMLPKQFSFLKSVRFWKLVLAGIGLALYNVGAISEALFALIEMVLLGSVTIRTFDRFGEKAGGSPTNE